MAGVWKRDGTVAVTNGSKKVTGTGTTFADTKNGVAKGHLFCITSGTSVDFYEVDYAVSNTELYLVQAYRGVTATGKAYEIITTFSDSVPEFARRLTATLSAYQQQSDAFQALLTSNAATIEVTAPDGTKQTLIPWKRVTSEGEGQATRAKAEADKAAARAEESKSAPRAAIPYMDYARYGINGKTPTLSLDFIKNEHRLYEGMAQGFNLKPLSQLMTFTRAGSAKAQGPLVMESAANDVLRVGYSGGAKLGALLEQQVTNLMLWPHPIAQGGSSGNQGQWYYNDNTKLTLSSISVTLPDGTTGAASRAVGLNQGYVRFTIGGVAGFTASLFVRDIVGQLILRGIGAGYTSWSATLNADGSVATSPTTGSLTVEKCPNGWFRIGMYDPAATSSYELQMGSGSINAVTIWGGQLESGAVMTSYIPTSGSQVTRANDVFRRTLTTELNTVYQSAFTVYFEFIPLALYTNGFIFQFDDGTTSGPKFYLFCNASGSGSPSLPNAWVVGESKKVAISFVDNGDGNYTVIRSSNGGPAISSVQAITGDSFSNIKRLSLVARYLNTTGSSYSGATGHLKSFAIFPVALNANELVEITK